MKRILKYLPLALLTFLSVLFVSCTKQEGRPEEDLEQHPTWTQEDSTAFWDKQQGDITINPYTL